MSTVEAPATGAEAPAVEATMEPAESTVEATPEASGGCSVFLPGR